MASFYVKHSRNPKKAVKFNVSIDKSTALNDLGEPEWVLSIGTTHPVISGSNNKRVSFIKDVDQLTIDAEIEKAVVSICEHLVWGQLSDDVYSPYITSFSPIGDSVPITSIISMDIMDDIPTSGIDMSELNVSLSDGVYTYDITSDLIIQGNPINYKITWVPKTVNNI